MSTFTPRVAVFAKNCYISGQRDCLVYQEKRFRAADVADPLKNSATRFCLVSQVKLVDVADFCVADCFRQLRGGWSEKVYFFVRTVLFGSYAPRKRWHLNEFRAHAYVQIRGSTKEKPLYSSVLRYFFAPLPAWGGFFHDHD